KRAMKNPDVRSRCGIVSRNSGLVGCAYWGHSSVSGSTSSPDASTTASFSSALSVHTAYTIVPPGAVRSAAACSKSSCNSGESRALRPPAHRAHARYINGIHEICAWYISCISDRRIRADLELGRLVLRAHQRHRRLAAEVARPRLGDPVGVRLLHRPFRQRRDEALETAHEPPHDRVRERHRALETCCTNEFDSIVDDGMLGLVGERE